MKQTREAGNWEVWKRGGKDPVTEERTDQDTGQKGGARSHPEGGARLAEQGGGTPERSDPAHPGENSMMGSGNEFI